MDAWDSRSWRAEGKASSCGVTTYRSHAVPRETTAVKAFATPEYQYTGYHRVHICMACVMPQATMKAPKTHATQLNGMSSRSRTTFHMAQGMSR